MLYDDTGASVVSSTTDYSIGEGTISCSFSVADREPGIHNTVLTKWSLVRAVYRKYNYPHKAIQLGGTNLMMKLAVFA